MVASLAPSTRDLACNPFMCPNWESKPVTFWFANPHSIHWATPARAKLTIIKSTPHFYSFTINFFKDFIYSFLDRGEGKEKERERNIDAHEKHWPVASCMPPTGVLASNPGMCHDWKSNQWPFSSQAGVQPTEPH